MLINEIVKHCHVDYMNKCAIIPYGDCKDTQNKVSHKSTGRYFDYNIRSDFQKYGIVYPNKNVLVYPPPELARYSPWLSCSSAQLIIELL